MAQWDLLNFYIPLGNFILFVVLFVLAFRKGFGGLARKQREEFLEAKLEAEKERRLLEKELEDLLFREREQAKNLRAMKEQAVVDSQKRGEQIIEDARFHASRIIEESKRLAAAEYEQARRALKQDLIEQTQKLALRQIADQRASSISRRYVDVQLAALHKLAPNISGERKG